MRNAFNGLISRLDTVEKRISTLQDISTASLKTKKQKQIPKKKYDNIKGLRNNYRKA